MVISMKWKDLHKYIIFCFFKGFDWLAPFLIHSYYNQPYSTFLITSFHLEIQEFICLTSSNLHYNLQLHCPSQVNITLPFSQTPTAHLVLVILLLAFCLLFDFYCSLENYIKPRWVFNHFLHSILLHHALFNQEFYLCRSQQRAVVPVRDSTEILRPTLKSCFRD